MNDFTKEFDLIVLGLAVTNSVMILAEDFTAPILLLFLTGVTMAINFFYAKMRLLAEEGESIGGIVQFYMHLLPLVLLVFIASSINSMTRFIVANLLFRFADIVGIVYLSVKLKTSLSKRDYSWLITDIIVMAYFGFFLLDVLWLHLLSETAMAALIFVLWCIDMLIDYRLQGSFYFDEKSDATFAVEIAEREDAGIEK